MSRPSRMVRDSRPDADATLSVVERLAEDMGRRWQAGERPLVEHYLADHPHVEGRPDAALELIAEEIYLRAEAGDDPAQADFLRRFPRWERQVQALLDCHRLLSVRAAAARFPEAGESLGDFRLLAELGRGASGRVFLATQPALADRPVVLKLAAGPGQEHLSLSRLQHTHVVPLHSVHEFSERGLRGLCQPYFGGASLAAVLALLRDVPPGKRTGQDLLRALDDGRKANVPTIPATGPARRFLARSSYVRAVCWIGACLADALHYAHERGLLHLDLKPSNVLLAADGQPMLLDFHLAHAPLAAGAPAPSGLGGTPGYMAPEQEAALIAVAERGRLAAAVDPRADVYALGVLLYEALGGARPANGPGCRLSQLNPRISRGLAAVLGRCVSANPATRYASAADVAADLRRHLADLPLQGVANRSPAERWRKWRRGRPLVLPVAGLVLGMALALGLFGNYLAGQNRVAESARVQAEDDLRQGRYAEARESFKTGLALSPNFLLPTELGRRLRDGVRRAQCGELAQTLHRVCERVRPLYQADFLPPGPARTAADRCREMWNERAAVLKISDQAGDPRLDEQVRLDLLDLAILGANLHVQLAGPAAGPLARHEALEWLAEAEVLLGPSCVLDYERHPQAQALGLKAPAREASLRPRNAWEHYALGRAHLQAGNLGEAASQLDRALELGPAALWPNFYKGVCALRQAHAEEALAAFSAAIALAPDSAACIYNRGRAYAELGRREQALGDYDRALRLDPSLAAARLARADVYRRENRTVDALADLDAALRDGIDGAVVAYQRTLVHLSRKDRDAAEASLGEAWRLNPAYGPACELSRQLQKSP